MEIIFFLSPSFLGFLPAQKFGRRGIGPKRPSVDRHFDARFAVAGFQAASLFTSSERVEMGPLPSVTTSFPRKVTTCRLADSAAPENLFFLKNQYFKK